MNCDKTKETSADILILHERSFILAFWQEEWFLRHDPIYLKFWSSWSDWRENADFQSIIASAVTHSKKVQLTLIRNLGLRPMSLRWKSYVAPVLSSQRASENGKRPFSVQNSTSSEEICYKVFFVNNVSDKVVSIRAQMVRGGRSPLCEYLPETDPPLEKSGFWIDILLVASQP